MRKHVDSEVMSGRLKRREVSWIRALADAQGVTASAYVAMVLRDHLTGCGRFWREELDRFWLMVERSAPAPGLPVGFERWPRLKRRAWLGANSRKEGLPDVRETHNGHHK